MQVSETRVVSIEDAVMRLDYPDLTPLYLLQSTFLTACRTRESKQR